MILVLASLSFVTVRTGLGFSVLSYTLAFTLAAVLTLMLIAYARKPTVVTSKLVQLGGVGYLLVAHLALLC